MENCSPTEGIGFPPPYQQTPYFGRSIIMLRGAMPNARYAKEGVRAFHKV